MPCFLASTPVLLVRGVQVSAVVDGTAVAKVRTIEALADWRG
jgi:hypothetical protein